MCSWSPTVLLKRQQALAATVAYAISIEGMAWHVVAQRLGVAATCFSRCLTPADEPVFAMDVITD